MKSKYDYITKEYLVNEHWNKQKSQVQIARDLSIPEGTIRMLFKRLGIKSRNLADANKVIRYIPITREYLYQEHIINKKTVSKIGRELKVSKEVIIRRLKEHNVPYIKTQGYTVHNKVKGIKKEVLQQKYTKENKTAKEIGVELNITANVILNRLKEFNIKRRRGGARKELWQNKEFKEKMLSKLFKSRKVKPNKPEKILKELLNILFPKEYKYVGDGKIIIGGFNPDFINCNGKKLAIEHFGDYWHANPKKYKADDIVCERKAKDIWKKDRKRLKTYSNYGYQTLVIWENELKNTDLLTKKLLKFNDTII